MQCEKIGYETYKAVAEAKRHLSKTMKESFESYKCKQCGKFHINTARNKRKSLEYVVPTSEVIPVEKAMQFNKKQKKK